MIDTTQDTIHGDWLIAGSYLEYVDDSSAKFYEILIGYNPVTDDARVTHRWGRIGTTGQAKLFVHPSLDRARYEAATQESRKLGKGYTVAGPLALTHDHLIGMGINPWVGDRPARDEVVTLEVVSKTVAAAMEAGYTDTDSSEVFQLKAKLTAQLAELRTAVHEIESSAEFADTFLTTKLQGVASGSNQ